MRGKHPMHLTHAYNLPRVRCGKDAKRTRRTANPELVCRDVNPCVACFPIAKAEIDAADREAP